jgi:transcriptional regulator with XRE-family HTH domain
MSTDADKALNKARGRRLVAAREQLKLTTAQAAAAFLKVPYDSYIQHERGERGMSRKVQAYAAKLGVEESWLLWGKNPPEWAQPELDVSAEEKAGGADHNLRAWRLHARMSVEDLAGKLEVPVDLVRAWEDGSTDLSEKWLRRIAVAFDTTPGSILDVDPASAPPGLLTLWRDTAAQQREAARRLQMLNVRAAG